MSMSHKQKIYHENKKKLKELINTTDLCKGIDKYLKYRIAPRTKFGRKLRLK